jgi:hypothetical protein
MQTSLRVAFFVGTFCFILATATIIHKVELYESKLGCTAYQWGSNAFWLGSNSGGKKISRRDLVFEDMAAQPVISEWAILNQHLNRDIKNYISSTCFEYTTMLELFRRNNSSFSANPGFQLKAHCQESYAGSLKADNGNLLLVEFSGGRHDAAAGAVGQNIIEAIGFGMGHIGMLCISTSPRMMIGSKKKEPDMSLNPKGGGFGNGVLDNGFGFPFPNLVVEVASSESLDQLLRELKRWISPETSVQVAIGIKIHGVAGSGVDGAVERIEGILFRRNFLNPDQWVQFYPVQPSRTPPVLRLYLSDLFFGVARDRLPRDLWQRIAGGATIDLDLDFVRERILEDGFKV